MMILVILMSMDRLLDPMKVAEEEAEEDAEEEAEEATGPELQYSQPPRRLTVSLDGRLSDVSVVDGVFEYSPESSIKHKLRRAVQTREPFFRQLRVLRRGRRSISWALHSWRRPAGSTEH